LTERKELNFKNRLNGSQQGKCSNTYFPYRTIIMMRRMMEMSLRTTQKLSFSKI